MGEGSRVNRKEVMYHIGKISFSMDDLRLFLDTHPNCREALERYNKLAVERAKWMEVYEDNFGPMNMYNSNGCDNRFRWVDYPLPWEGEC